MRKVMERHQTLREKILESIREAILKGQLKPGEKVAEPELADSAPIVRHRKLAAIGWSQTAERLVAYLERRTPWDS